MIVRCLECGAEMRKVHDGDGEGPMYLPTCKCEEKKDSFNSTTNSREKRKRKDRSWH